MVYNVVVVIRTMVIVMAIVRNRPFTDQEQISSISMAERPVTLSVLVNKPLATPPLPLGRCHH